MLGKSGPILESPTSHGKKHLLSLKQIFGSVRLKKGQSDDATASP